MGKERFRKRITDCTCLVTKGYGSVEEHLYVSPVALVYNVFSIDEDEGKRRGLMIHAVVPLKYSTAQFLIHKVKKLSAGEAFKYLKRVLDENWKIGKVRNECHILPCLDRC